MHQVIIPEDCSDDQCRLLVVDLGHLIVMRIESESDKSADDTFRASSVSSESFVTPPSSPEPGNDEEGEEEPVFFTAGRSELNPRLMAKLSYDLFSVDLTDVQVSKSKSGIPTYIYIYIFGFVFLGRLN